MGGRGRGGRHGAAGEASSITCVTTTLDANFAEPSQEQLLAFFRLDCGLSTPSEC
ncbi:hypothetical protein J6590_096871 [Homalodisca vitripennis]|nr:hypothetical protein J6590_096871 [Homalodisca vitripennis]